MRLVLCIALVAAAAVVHGQTPAPKKQIVEDLRLDATTEDFPDVGSVMVGSRGQIVVGINNDQQLRFYDAAGKRTATFGRKGSGPGEFQRMTQRGWVGDTLWVYDVSLRRITYIAPGATLLRIEPLPGNLNTLTASTTRGAPPPGAGAIGLYSPSAVAGGRYVGVALVRGERNTDGTVASSSKIMAVRAGDSTGTRDRVFLANGPDASQASFNYRPGDGSAYSQVIPFTFYPATVFSPDGSRFGIITTQVGEKGGTYTIEMFSIIGKTAFKRAYPFVGTPIPSSAADSALDAIGVGSDGKPFFPPAVAAKLREGIRPLMPKVYAPVSAMVLGPDGTTWISGRITPKGRQVTAIDARGNQIFTIELPPKTRLVQANRTTLWAIQTDADDLPSVVRYRIK